MKQLMTTVIIVLVFFGYKELRYYLRHGYHTPVEVQTVQKLQQAQQQYQPNQPEASLTLDSEEGLVREDAVGLTSIAYQEGYEWARKYQIVNPEWCANQDKQGDFMIGCEDYALEQSGE